MANKSEEITKNTQNPMWITTLCGLTMGAADIVPGVSGGTVALVLGIYHRLLSALSNFNGKLIGYLLGGRWRQAAVQIDLGFLLPLGVGILSGVIGLATLIEHLLIHHRPATYSLFFGLILGSGVLVGRLVKATSAKQKWRCVFLGITGGLLAMWLATLDHRESMPGPLYTFVCGTIGISAMILPGISGAHLLLLLGKYEEMTSIIKGLPRGETTANEFITLMVFCAGCLTGLLLFSRFIRWLLEKCNALTLATLCGFMIGSLLRVWPFQKDITPEVEAFKHKQFEAIWPSDLGSGELTCLVVAILGFSFVMFADMIAKRTQRSIEPSGESSKANQT